MNISAIEDRITDTLDRIEQENKNRLLTRGQRQISQDRLTELTIIRGELNDANPQEPEEQPDESHLIYSARKDVDGPFNMKTGKLIAGVSKTAGETSLCFQENVRLRFATIKLFDINATREESAATCDDSKRLADEICRRWNCFSSHKDFYSEFKKAE